MAYPEAKTIHLVMDNLNIHRRKALADVFGPDMAAEVCVTGRDFPLGSETLFSN